MSQWIKDTDGWKQTAGNVNPNELQKYKNDGYLPKNMFDGVSVINAYIDTSIHSDATARTVYAKCKPSTTYTVSKTSGTRFQVAYTSTLPTLNTLCRGLIANNTASSITITTDADAQYIVAYVFKSNTDTITESQMLSSVQIEEGSTATTYTPYAPSNTSLMESLTQLSTVTSNDYVSNGITFSFSKIGSIKQINISSGSLSSDVAAWGVIATVDAEYRPQRTFYLRESYSNKVLIFSANGNISTTEALSSGTSFRHLQLYI